jgi:hypothetical protein
VLVATVSACHWAWEESGGTPTRATVLAYLSKSAARRAT